MVYENVWGQDRERAGKGVCVLLVPPDEGSIEIIVASVPVKAIFLGTILVGACGAVAVQDSSAILKWST